ncbi:autoinducer binding domain-containing protein [Planktotalea arctica]|uniref:autoinducer binding domain-containing protein n=1 Tax=Planktotalea arctica TaxID=1481893 RepID=UPI000A170F1F|nr:autoinducer binding domain-containing protein [Planktotalea arctica]
MDIVDLGALEKSEAGFTSFLTDLCDKLELDFATYCAVNTVSDQVIGFSTYSNEWKEHYGAQRFQNVDPTLHLPMRSIAPVDWQRLSEHEDFKKVFEHARDFNIAEQGLSIPIHGPYGEVGLISVARDCSRETWDKLRKNVIGELQTAAVSLHDTVMQSDTLGHALRRPHLSSRECEVLQWTAAGKSQIDIGDILSISSRTVEVHLRSARSKLCALTTPQAVGRAIAMGFIYPK